MKRWPFVIYALLALAGFGGAAVVALGEAGWVSVPGTSLND